MSSDILNKIVAVKHEEVAAAKKRRTLRQPSHSAMAGENSRNAASM